MKKDFRIVSQMLIFSIIFAAFLTAGSIGQTEETGEQHQVSGELRQAIRGAIERLTPALVKIHVVEVNYYQGREMKHESYGSGVVISSEGHVITNHHVAGNAKQIKCIFSNKKEYEGEIVGTDPLTDLTVIRLKTDEPIEFPSGQFGDSDAVEVGDYVLAMGCPMALSQSVTVGVVSNTEMIMPDWIRQWGGGLRQDGEDVGLLVRWIGHDAEIYGGNSGGPLVNLQGEIIGINEIRMGLSGAIPGNLARDISTTLLEQGEIRRSWLGLEIQPRLKHDGSEKGALVSTVFEGAPAEKAGVQAGDLLLSLGGRPVDVQYPVQMPDFYRLASDLPIDESVEAAILRDGKEMTVTLVPNVRERFEHDEWELKQWGMTARNLSFILARELKRENKEGVLVASVRPGGPVGTAKPFLREQDVIVSVNGEPVENVERLKSLTREIMEGAEEPRPVLVTFDRKNEQLMTVVEVGIEEIRDPGREVKKAWLHVETQVITRDMAEQLDNEDLTGFRITHVYKGTTAEQAGLKVGDLIAAVDGQKMKASAPEHYEELAEFIRQYRTGMEVEVGIIRDEEEMEVAVELAREPEVKREMKKYEDLNFEFTVRNIGFLDNAREKWPEEQMGVLVDNMERGGWAALGGLQTGDLILRIDDDDIHNVEQVQEKMEQIENNQPEAVIIKVLRGIRTRFLELEPKWNSEEQQGKEPEE